MILRTITIRGVSDAVLKRLRSRAATERRSLNSEVLLILESAAASRPGTGSGSGTPTAAGDVVHEPAPAYVAVHTSVDPLADIDREAIAEICRRHHIRRLDVFGSLAEGRARAGSDADVVVEFEPGRTPGFGIVRIAEALSPAFGGRRVELHTPYEVRRLHERVMTSATTLYAAE